MSAPAAARSSVLRQLRLDRVGPGLAALAPLRVLLATSDEALRMRLTRSLGEDGFAVVAAADGVEAHRLLRPRADAHPLDLPNLIVAGARLPGRSGLQLLADLNEARWGVPVILLVGAGDAGARAEADRLGAAATFEAPYDVDDLRTASLDLAWSP